MSIVVVRDACEAEVQPHGCYYFRGSGTAGVAFKVVHVARHGGYFRLPTDFMSWVGLAALSARRVVKIVNEGCTEST